MIVPNNVLNRVRSTIPKGLTNYLLMPGFEGTMLS